MAGKVSFRQKRREAPEWIFRWKSPGEPLLPKLLALFGVFAVFALVLGSVRIRAASRNPLEIRRASCILATDHGEGRALALAARENGPFPSRLDLEAWLLEKHLGNSVQDLLAWHPAARAPEPRPLPPEPLGTGRRLASGGDPVFPKFPPLNTPDVPQGMAASPHPVMRVLSAAAPDFLPITPKWSGTANPQWLGGSWKFLLHLDATGTVREVLSMADVADGTADAPLSSWLRQHRFPSAPANDSRWIGVTVTFENLPAHGPDAH